MSNQINSIIYINNLFLWIFFFLISNLGEWWVQEAYCSALSKLKEAMEEPQQETIAFINAMHSQLRDLSDTSSISGIYNNKKIIVYKIK